jgi:transposase InsO family protein
MPWDARDTMSLRQEFVLLATHEGSNRRELCRRFGISPKTAYKWLARYAKDKAPGLEDRSRRPLCTPSRTPSELEAQVLALRQQHPAWGGRKISKRLKKLGYADAPAPSTVTSILHRHGLISEAASTQATAWQRFEHPQPNELWQIDFKGYFPTPAGLCYPLTVLDDHSRFNLVLAACARTNTQSVQPLLTEAFRRYGLPVRINADNGSPWGSPSEREHGITRLTVWLIRLGICISHSAPAHPQTNGKDERFHRSLKAEVLNGRSFNDLQHAQRAFDYWRHVYNKQRPHEALDLATPIERYRPSARTFPEQLPSIQYGPDDIVTEVGWDGRVRFKGRTLKVSNALHRLPIAFRSDPIEDGAYDVYFCHKRFMRLSLQDFDSIA